MQYTTPKGHTEMTFWPAVQSMRMDAFEILEVCTHVAANSDSQALDSVSISYFERY